MVLRVLLKPMPNPCTFHVTTLALGSRLRQGLVKVRAKSEVRESHFMFPRV
jgi:hypothetical protein